VSIALALLAAGCSGKKNVDYSVSAVRAAFADVGVRLYGQNQPYPTNPLTPGRLAQPHARPLTALLRGIHDAVFLPSLRHAGRPVTLHTPTMLVLVYPRSEAAQGKVRSLEDIVGAQEILHTTDFGFAVNGNVVVEYRVFNMDDRIPGYLGQWETIGALNDKIRTDATKGLAGLH
jgi:hypothetical protein